MRPGLMTRDVAIVCRDPVSSMGLVVALRGMPYEITVIEARASRTGLPGAAIHGRPDAIVMDIADVVDVVELRQMLTDHAESRFLFLADRVPLRPAAARIIRRHGGAVLSRSEPAIVVVSTLVALLSGDHRDL